MGIDKCVIAKNMTVNLHSIVMSSGLKDFKVKCNQVSTQSRVWDIEKMDTDISIPERFREY